MQEFGVWLWVIVAAVVVLAVGVALYAGGRARGNRRTAALRRHFGQEYDRVITESGGRRRGEAELERRLERRREVAVRDLDEAERDRFGEAWESAQSAFVDTPVNGLREADLLVMQVMRNRGYPVEHFEERADLVSVDHPELVEHFRTAHEIALANEGDAADTEQLRQAMVHYRYLFDELLQGGETNHVPRV